MWKQLVEYVIHEKAAKLDDFNQVSPGKLISFADLHNLNLVMMECMSRIIAQSG
jgi:hypothetical protein